MFRFFLMILSVLAFSAFACAQGADDENRFPEVTQPEVLSELTFETNAPGFVRTCEYYVDEFGEIQEKCEDYGRTFGGIEVPVWAVPFQVQILTTPKAATDEFLRRRVPDQPLWQLRHVCGGALIHNDWVITAAHCFKDSQNARHYGIRLKAESISENLREYERVEKVVLHPKFGKPGLENDIALLKMKRKWPRRNFPAHQRVASMNRIGEWGSHYTASTHRLTLFPPEGYSNNYFSIWDMETGRKIYHLEKQDVVSRDLYRDLELDLLYGTDATSAWMFDVNVDQEVFRIPGTQKYSGITLSKDRTKIVTWSPIGLIEIRDLKTRQLIQTVDAVVPIKKIEVKGLDLLIHSQLGNKYSLDTETYDIKKVDVTWTQHFSPDGSFVIRAPRGQAPTLTRVTNNQDETPREISVENPEWYTLTNNSVVVHHSDTKTILDKDTLEVTRTIPLSDYRIIDQYDELMIIYNKSDRLQIVDTESGKDIGSIKVDETFANDETKRIIVTHDRSKLVHWMKEGKSQIWDIPSGKLIKDINHSLGLGRLFISSDSRYLVSSSQFGPTDIYSMETGEPVTRIFHRGIIGVKFVDNNQKLLTSDRHGIAKLWEVENSESGVSTKPIAELDIRQSSGNAPSQDITIIDLAKLEPDEGAPLWAYGWGRTRNERGRDPVSILRMIEIYKISDDLCAEKGNLEVDSLGENEFCGFDEKRKTCRGDSGGPVTSEGVLVGISSWGSGNCGLDEKPTGLSNVAYHRDWIVGTICRGFRERFFPSEFCKQNRLGN